MSIVTSGEPPNGRPPLVQSGGQQPRLDVVASRGGIGIDSFGNSSTGNNKGVHTVTKPHESQQLLRSSNSDPININNKILPHCSSQDSINAFELGNLHHQSNFNQSSTNRAIEKCNNESQQHQYNLELSLIKSRNQQQRQVRYKSLLASNTVINEGDESINTCDNSLVSPNSKDGQELIDFSILQHSTTKHCDIIRGRYEDENTLYEIDRQPKASHNHSIEATTFSDDDSLGRQVAISKNFFDENDDDEQHHRTFGNRSDLNRSSYINEDDKAVSPSHHRLKSIRQRQQGTYIGGLLSKFSILTSNLRNKASGSIPYYTDDSLSPSGNQVHQSISKRFRLPPGHHSNKKERSFRGPYRFSRLGIVMALLKRLFTFLFQRSTLALFGAFLIHVTLGTVYTLSNVNSYLTSYMRKHGSPNATYGSSLWVSSSYSVGQGLSMVLGGYLERRFSARLACTLGCLLHSLSVMSTSIAVDYGQLAVLVSYGLLPGFGCGLAYMTPMSNGFGWFPNRKGLVAGTILAGFGIGTFVFNMAQTVYVNPENLSPPLDAGGYFTQQSILNNVPDLFVFLGMIYASMQFIGCCLLFKPPSPNPLESITSINKVELHDERPLLMSSDEITSHDRVGSSGTHPVISQLPFKKAIRTREFIVLFIVFGVTNQGVLFVNSMLKEYAQIFITDDMYLAWTGSMASIANSMGRLCWGLAIDRYSFTQCFTAITSIFGLLMFLMPFKFILSSKLFYLLCTLGLFGSFSGWMSTYPVHLSRVFGIKNSGMVYGLIVVSQSLGGIMMAFGAHYLIDHYSRFVPFFLVTFLEVLGLSIYHLFYFR